MKKFTSFLSIALVASLFVTTSCSDDDEKSKTDLLTEKSWSITKAEIRTSTSGPDYDVSNMYIEDYEKDNIITFSRDKKYNETVGTDDGDGAETDNSGTWELKDDEKTLAIAIDGDIQDSELLTLTSTTLKVNAGKIQFDTNGDGIDDEEVSILYTLTAK